ncbi:probable E3 ubiquitin-protein ligase BAH1-like isoform X1 [Rhododendron vialii]|uniref:probable E3 ubiquitin-protein ligase BAH1-like isoform X1 n=1 Tax=Rhododendron vialii TaxID=182163 RepID=UPI00265E2524|nr:probable E3 ubiquitin-protein ligase BAH1-like isoform X1 [Rhododendron vialii]
MKFGEAFMEYVNGNQERFTDKCSHVEYKRLKKVLKSCRACRGLRDSCPRAAGQDELGNQTRLDSEFCQCEACPLCDQMFFSELMKEASEIAGFFSSRVRHLLQLHIATGMQRYMICLRQCFKDDHQAMAQEGQMLIEYVTMNAIALRKILKKYDKVHRSVKGRNFKSKMRAKHIEILQSPWLIELGAFYKNCDEPDGPNLFSSSFSCDLNAAEPVLTLMLPDSVTLEYNLNCAICLDLVFNPYALSCGHIFCKLCACSAAKVMVFQGLKAANPESKCPVCREEGVYGDAVQMIELDLLLKKRCKDYWKERLVDERAEMVKQSKFYWEIQAKYMFGY